MFIPIGGPIISMTFYTDICSACSVIEARSLHLLLELLIRIPFLLLFFLFNFPNNISPLIFEALLCHYIIICPLYTDSGSDFSSRLSERVSPFGREFATPVESTLVILILSVNDLLGPEVFHGVLNWTAHLHLFN
jgi:hypothetical protein